MELYTYSSSFWNVEFASSKIGYLSEAVFKLLLPAYSKKCEQRYCKLLKDRIVKQKKKQNLNIHIIKNKKTKTKRPFHKKISMDWPEARSHSNKSNNKKKTMEG